MEKLSVIIAVYKAKETLDRCVSSVLAQNIADMEVILVADGDVDGSYALCNEWAERDPRIRAILIPHGGLSVVRNYGISVARGTLITFVDSDDSLNPGVYEQLLPLMAAHPEWSFAEYSMRVIGSDKVDTNYTDHIYADAYHYWKETHAWNHAYMCNKIFRSSVFEGVEFPPGRYYEDAWILPSLLKRSQKVATFSLVGYNYYVTPGCITSKRDARTIRQLLEALMKMQQEMGAKWYHAGLHNFFMSMLYRQVDLYRISGEILLNWPCIRFICWMHQHTKGRNR